MAKQPDEQGAADAPRDESYGAFAYAYDDGLGEHFFNAVRPLLLDMLEKYPAATKTHLDLACGTGLTLQLFAERGYDSVGVDASLPMLQIARRRRPRVTAGDFRALPFRRTFARITCMYDSLNHLLDRADLIAAFKAVRGVMNSESLFLFDMNHPDIYPAVWGMTEPYVSSGAKHHLEIATSYRRREKLGQALVSGWAMLPDGTRAEIAETHRQRAYREKDIVSALDEAGLVPEDVFDFDPFREADPMDAGGVKLFFVVRVK
jgi:SAM-dependent methyltransferase